MRNGVLILLLFLSGVSFSQNNSWINYSQKYFEIPIYETGVYRLDSTSIANALNSIGEDLSSVDPQNIQVFGREKENSIYVEGELDGVFNSQDYVEFYAKKNDTWQEKDLFTDPDFLLNRDYSFTNDTIRYFLTWGSSPGKRMRIDSTLSTGGLTPVDYVLRTNHVNYSDEYLVGDQYEGVSRPTYGAGEGWTSLKFNKGSGKTTTLNTANIYSGLGAPDVFFETTVAGASRASALNTGVNGNHWLQVLYENSAGTNVMVVDSTYYAYQTIRSIWSVPASEIGTSTNVRHNSVSSSLPSDYQAVGEVYVTYPHTTNFENSNYFDFEIMPNLTGNSFIQGTNFNGANPMLYVFDGDSIKKVIPNGLDAVVQNSVSGNNQKALLFDESKIITRPLSPVFKTGKFRDLSAQLVDSVYLVITNKILIEEARMYAGYRNSLAGGSYDTLVIDAEQLYYQYGGGVRKSGSGLRNFAHHALSASSVKPSGLFLIGKSVMEASEGNFATSTTVNGVRSNSASFRKCLVPSIGYPSCDDYISKYSSDITLEAKIPTGRLSAVDSSDVIEYLEKMQLYESNQNQNSVYTIDDKEWQKEIMHFRGGGDVGLQNTLRNYLANYEATLEDTLYGGNVHTFFKESSAPISIIAYDEVNDRIRAGASIMTFFGHAAASGFDANIDDPTNWNNYGKYPIVVGLGCHAGDIHQPNLISASENFVNQKDEGSISYISTVTSGFTTGLNQFAREFFESVSIDNYGGNIGQHVQYSKQQINENGGIDIVGTVANVNIQGDPLLKVNYHNKPELVLNESRVFFEPEEITLAIDSFDINIVVTNLGKTVKDTVSFEVTRVFPDGSDTLYLLSLDKSFYRDTITITMPVEHSISEGLNYFDIRVDIPNEIDELYDEIGNNQLIIQKYINLDGIVPIYPYNYAIVPEPVMTLKASTVNPFASAKDYRFELDLRDEYNTPFARYQTINSEGGVVELDPANWLLVSDDSPAPLSFTDSTVYFWRGAKDSSVFSWTERSFQYIDGKIGWGQAHFHQYKNNDYFNLIYNKPIETFEIGPSSLELIANTVSNATNASDKRATNFSVGGSQKEYWGYYYIPAIHVAVIDPITLEPWKTPDLSTGFLLNDDHFFGHQNTYGRSTRADAWFQFSQRDNDQMDSLEIMINNEVPDGHYLMFLTLVGTDYASLDTLNPGLYTMFQNLGSTGIVQGKDDEAFIFFCRKGDPSSAVETFSSILTANGGAKESISLSAQLEVPKIGTNKSVVAGPAREWHSLHWAQHSLETPITDSTAIRVYGLSQAGSETLLLDTTYTSIGEVLNLGDFVDAVAFPYVRLESYHADNVGQTPSQNDRWQLLYDPVPEAALNPLKGLHLSVSDSLSHGAMFEFAIAIENVSDYDMDSLLVHYEIEDRNNVRHLVPYQRQDSLKAGEILYDTILIPTENYPGKNKLWIAANPIVGAFNVQDQNEQYYFNNVAFIDFYAETDKINPILDVTFDGIHILNKDIVSPKPFISISLDDENQYFVFDDITDTVNFSLFIKNPGSNSFDPLRFNSGSGEEIVRFVEASLPANKCRLEWEPNFNSDGIYTLLVQAKDKSGNESGSVDYTIEFEVINRSTITNILNYPNPFSTRTQFVFTLTGSKIPEYFKIQIMSVSGRVVREIMKDELGDLRIGRNRTDYYWDGKDQFGDQLANGVYFYQVITKIEGDDIEHRTTGADQFFKKEFGKMYLMR